MLQDENMGETENKRLAKTKINEKIRAKGGKKVVKEKNNRRSWKAMQNKAEYHKDFFFSMKISQSHRIL